MLTTSENVKSSHDFTCGLQNAWYLPWLVPEIQIKLPGEHFVIYTNALTIYTPLMQILTLFPRTHPEEIITDVYKDICIQLIISVCIQLLTKTETTSVSRKRKIFMRYGIFSASVFPKAVCHQNHLGAD